MEGNKEATLAVACCVMLATFDCGSMIRGCVVHTRLEAACASVVASCRAFITSASGLYYT